jgi:single-stranded DNA-binding protein
MAAYAQISGRLGLEPELRFTNSGTPVINLSIANNRSIKVGDKRETVADWFKVTVFGRRKAVRWLSTGDCKTRGSWIVMAISAQQRC